MHRVIANCITYVRLTRIRLNKDFDIIRTRKQDKDSSNLKQKTGSHSDAQVTCDDTHHVINVGALPDIRSGPGHLSHLSLKQNK